MKNFSDVEQLTEDWNTAPDGKITAERKISNEGKSPSERKFSSERKISGERKVSSESINAAQEVEHDPSDNTHEEPGYHSNASNGYQDDGLIEMRNSEEPRSQKGANEDDEMVASLRCGSSLSQIEEQAGENFARENPSPVENGAEECNP